MSRQRPPARNKAPVPPDRRHRTPVKVKVSTGPRIPLWGWVLAVGVVLIGAVVVTAAAMNRSGGGSSANTPQLAPMDTSATGATVDGIECGSTEQTLFHIHAHLAVMVNGSSRSIPEGIGITPPRDEVQTSSGPEVVSGSCFYWLHTHTADGIIHIESPVQRTFTLGDFFNIWGQPLSATQVGPATGTVTAYVNGQKFTGDPRTIPLTAHAVIQLNVGSDSPPASYTFPSGL